MPAVVVAGTTPPELGVSIVASYLASLQSDRSRSTVLESLRRVSKALGIEDYRSIPWGMLGYDRLQVIRQSLADTFAPATANVTLSAVRGVLRVGYLTHRITLDQWTAAQNTRKIKGTRVKKGRSLSEDEIAQLFDACDRGQRVGSTPPPRCVMLRALVATMCGLGLRREEAGEPPSTKSRATRSAFWAKETAKGSDTSTPPPESAWRAG